MLYTCCNSSRNTWQRCCNGCGNTANTANTNSCGCYCGCGNTANTTNANGCGTNTLANGVYGIFFPVSSRSCVVRRTTTLYCGNAGTWTNTANASGYGCGCRRNLCTTGDSSATLNGDAYYARQYGLTANSGCGCGCGCGTWCGV